MERIPRIAVCDDDKTVHDEIYHMLLEYNKQHSEEQMLFAAFESGKALLEYKDRLDLLFLDIELNDRSGIDIVPQIREKYPECLIIFISSHTKYFVYSHRVHVFQFLTKPFDAVIFFEELDRFYAQYHLAQDLYTLSYEGREVSFPICEIVYMESYLRHLKVYHSRTGRYDITGQISKEEQVLSAYGFIRCHHGFLVNPRYIDSIKGQTIYLTVPEDMRQTIPQEIPVSRNKLQQAKQAYQLWLQEQKD